MANLLPPILSDTPPPLDDGADDNDVEDGGFGDFGAPDFGFDLSGVSDNSRDSPEVWNTPSTNSDPSRDERHLIKNNDEAQILYHESISTIDATLNDIKPVDKIHQIKPRTDSELCRGEDNQSINPLNDNLDIPEAELDNISPVSFEMQFGERTSPEGADAESTAGDFKPIDIPPELKEFDGIENFTIPENPPDLVLDKLSPLDSLELQNKHTNLGEQLRSLENNLSKSPEDQDLENSVDYSKNVVNSSFSLEHFSVSENPTNFGFDQVRCDAIPSESNTNSECESDLKLAPKSDLELPVISDDNVDDGFDDFADFTSQPFVPELPASKECGQVADVTPSVIGQENVDDDFDDFDDFACAVPSEHPVVPFVSQTPSNLSQVPQLDVETRLAAIFSEATFDERSEHEIDGQLTRCLNTCLDDSSSVWGRLKHLDTSPALTLSWPTSSASRRMLTALSVDSRNILVGQRWNSFVPRYAAHIGTPMEPTKPVPDPPAPIKQPSVDDVTDYAPPPLGVVPAAQFDWNGSGLTNPLDFSPSSLLDLDFLIKFDNVASSSPHAASSDWTSHPSVEKKEAEPVRASELTIGEPCTWLPHSSLPSSDILLLTSPSVPTVPVLPTVKDAREASLDWTGMRTISSDLDVTPSVHLTTPGPLSVEACKVVDSIPDLSFLSARKLLFAANENLTRFHATARQ